MIKAENKTIFRRSVLINLLPFLLTFVFYSDAIGDEKLIFFIRAIMFIITITCYIPFLYYSNSDYLKYLLLLFLPSLVHLVINLLMIMLGMTRIHNFNDLMDILMYNPFFIINLVFAIFSIFFPSQKDK